MICGTCKNEFSINNYTKRKINWCPFCGSEITEVEKFALYTMGEFFSFAGDDEFDQIWGELKKMTSHEALSWIRNHPPIRKVYKIQGKIISSMRKMDRRIERSEIKHVMKFEGGTIVAKEHTLGITDLRKIGDTVFLNKEDCEEAIRKEIEKC